MPRQLRKNSPRVAAWTVSTPHAGSTDALSIAFHESLDQALLARALVVRDAVGKPVQGRTIIPAGETQWSFVPAALWAVGRYAIEVDTDLEDLAGNNLRRLFDTDLTDRSAPKLERGQVASLSMTIR